MELFLEKLIGIYLVKKFLAVYCFPNSPPLDCIPSQMCPV
jgi:hypothetical protein